MFKIVPDGDSQPLFRRASGTLVVETTLPKLGLPFTATVECELNYAIFKGDYYTLGEAKTRKISIGERNEQEQREFRPERHSSLL